MLLLRNPPALGSFDPGSRWDGRHLSKSTPFPPQPGASAPQGMESGDGKVAWRRPDTTPWESHQTQGRKGCSRPAKAAKSSWGNRPARIHSSKENRSVRRKPHAWWFASRCRALGKVKRGSTWRQLIRPSTARLSSLAEKPERSLACIALVVCPHRAPLD